MYFVRPNPREIWKHHSSEEQNQVICVAVDIVEHQHLVIHREYPAGKLDKVWATRVHDFMKMYRKVDDASA